VGVDEHWEIHPPEPPDEPVEASGVVEVAVAAHDHLDGGRVDVEATHVVGDTIGADAGVEEDAVLTVALGDGHEKRQAREKTSHARALGAMPPSISTTRLRPPEPSGGRCAGP